MKRVRSGCVESEIRGPTRSSGCGGRPPFVTNSAVDIRWVQDNHRNFCQSSVLSEREGHRRESIEIPDLRVGYHGKCWPRSWGVKPGPSASRSPEPSSINPRESPLFTNKCAAGAPGPSFFRWNGEQVAPIRCESQRTSNGVTFDQWRRVLGFRTSFAPCDDGEVAFWPKNCTWPSFSTGEERNFRRAKRRCCNISILALIIAQEQGRSAEFRVDTTRKRSLNRDVNIETTGSTPDTLRLPLLLPPVWFH